MANVLTNMIKRLMGNKSNNDVTPQNETSDNDDNKEYLDFDLLEKKDFVHLESAYQNQEYVFRRATETNRLVLGELLEPILKVNKSSLLSMAVAYRLGDFGDAVEENVIKSPEDIWNYDLFSCVLKNKTDEGHYTTARDLVTAARYGLTQDLFRKIVTCMKYTLPATDKRDPLVLTLKWEIFDPESEYYIPHSAGIKSGYTSSAGFCYVGAYQENGTTLIAAVMGCRRRNMAWTDLKRLFAYGMTEFEKAD